MKKVLFITSEYPPGPGGIGNQAFHLVGQLARQGVETVVVTEKRPYSGIRPAGRIVYLQRDRLFPLRFFRAVWRQIKTFRPQVVFFSGTKALALAAVGPLFSGRKRLLIYHGHEWHMGPRWLRPLIRRGVEQANEVVAVSRFSRSRIAAFTNRKVTVIPNGVSLPASPPPVSGRSAPPAGRLALLTVGAVSERKGQLNVVRALPLLQRHFPQLTYHVAGVPLLRGQLLAEAGRLQVAGRVRIHGVVPSDILAQLYRQADMFILLSNNLSGGDVEGFGIAVLEANAYGIPAIGAKGTGIEEAIKNGYNGILVDAENAEQIKSAVLQIRNNYQEYSLRSLEWAGRFEWNTIIRQYWQRIT